MMNEASPPVLRTVRSFVLRQGRLTASQKRAMELYWPDYGLRTETGLLDAEKTFGRQAPWVLEIGFGNGQSLLKMMAQESDKDFIGIEVHRPGVGGLINSAQQQDLHNLKIYNEDALDVLNLAIPDESLSRVQLFFPDPWHKKKHHKRRIVQPEFAALIRSKLKICGVFHMASDWQNYAEHMLDVMTAAPGFTNLAGSEHFVPRPAHRPVTHFEQRGQRLGHGIWDLMFEKSA